MDEIVSNLFHDLADLSPADRERIFRERQVGSDVRSEVEALLKYDAEGSQNLVDCVLQAAEQVLALPDSRGSDIECGPYRLIRLLGSGGMGDVYLAERSDGEIQQKVAIKFLAAHHYSPVWRSRFLKERQLLASLNHASLVHVIDAGHTPDGKPYLVMEYVEGVPIDVYSERIALRDRLGLFLQVCEGVSHAHRRLIIHRDIKPSNILVDATAQPKLLDFGIAKLLDETGDQTLTAERLLTPAYASPEQLQGLPQTTATDVYSLGAVLYKLLTGRSPHESQTGTPATITSIIGNRKITPPTSIDPALPRDLDYVIGKALRIEPEERYASVDAFAGDVRAVLESRPVQARSGDAWYRTRKFPRRNWMPVAAAAVAIASLSAGLFVANRERSIAQQRFLDVRQLATKLFDIDFQVRQLPGGSKTRQLIVDTSLEYLRRLAPDAGHDHELDLEVGNAYMRVARVQGVPISANLGQMDRAEQNLKIADRYVSSVLKAQPQNRVAILRAAQIAHDRMLLARFNGSDKDALDFARTSAKWLERFSPNLKDRPEVEAALATYMNVAQQHRMGQQFDDALRLSKRGTELAQSLSSKPYLGMFHWVSAGVLQRRGELDQALSEIQSAVRLLEPGPATTDVGRTMNYVLALTAEGLLLGNENGISLDRSQEALAPLKRAFEVADNLVHKDAQDQGSRGRVTEAGLGLANLLRSSDAGAALSLYDHVLGHLAEIKNNSSFRRYEARAFAGSAIALQKLGRAVEGRSRMDTAFERLRQLKQYPAEKVKVGSELEEILTALVDFEGGNGQFQRAAEISTRLIEQLKAGELNAATNLEDAVHLSNLYRKAALLERRTAAPDVASKFDSERLELWRHWNAAAPSNAFVQRQLAAARTG